MLIKKQGILSLSISRSEQSIFEEEFKYLIVTSSLFNEQPLDATSRESPSEQQPDTTQPSSSLMLRLVYITLLNVMINSILINSRFNYVVSPSLIPCLLPLYITACYFIYRHHVSFFCFFVTGISH